MFGLFKSKPRFNSPEERLSHDMKRKIEKMAFLVYEQSPMKGTPLEGMAFIGAINDAKEFYLSRSIDVSTDYGVSRETVKLVVNQSAQFVHNKLID